MKVPKLLAIAASFTVVALCSILIAPYAFANGCPDGKSPVYMTTPSGKTKTLCVPDEAIPGLEQASENTGLVVEIPCPCAIDGQFEDVGVDYLKRCSDHFKDEPEAEDRWLGTNIDVYNPGPTTFIDQINVVHYYDPDLIPLYGEYWCQGFKYRQEPYEYTELFAVDITSDEAEACWTLIMDTAALFDITCD